MSNKVLIFILVTVIAVIAIMWYTKNKKLTTTTPTTAKDALTKGRPTPQPSWTEWDWLKNGYTQSEIDAAKKVQSTMNNLLPI